MTTSLRQRCSHWCRSWWTLRAPRGQFWVYFFAAIFFNLGFSIFFFLFNLYLLELGVKENFLGLVGSMMAVGNLCGTLPAGVLAERIGLRTTLLCGISIAIIAAALRSIFVWMPAQLALAVVSGLSMSTWGVCLSPTVAGLTTEEQRPAAFSLMFSSGIGVAGLGAFAAGHFPSWIRTYNHAQWTLLQSERATLLVACALATIALIPISRISLAAAAPRVRFVRPSTPFLRAFLPAMAVWALVTGAFPPFAGVYFVHHLGLSLEAMGSVFSLSQLVSFFAILAAPVLLRRAGLATGVMLTQLSTAAMLFLLASTNSHTHAAWCYWGYMAFQCMNEPGIYSLLMDHVRPDERNGASSYTFFVSASTQIVASLAVGFLIVRFNYPAVLFGIAGLAVVAALMFKRLSMIAPPQFKVDGAGIVATQ